MYSGDSLEVEISVNSFGIGNPGSLRGCQNSRRPVQWTRETHLAPGSWKSARVPNLDLWLLIYIFFCSDIPFSGYPIGVKFDGWPRGIRSLPPLLGHMAVEEQVMRIRVVLYLAPFFVARTNWRAVTSSNMADRMWRCDRWYTGITTRVINVIAFFFSSQTTLPYNAFFTWYSFFFFFWLSESTTLRGQKYSRGVGSNHRPPGLQPGALPTEL